MNRRARLSSGRVFIDKHVELCSRDLFGHFVLGFGTCGVGLHPRVSHLLRTRRAIALAAEEAVLISLRLLGAPLPRHSRLTRELVRAIFRVP